MGAHHRRACPAPISVRIRQRFRARGMPLVTAQILNQLTHAEALPKAALQAASEQRAEIVPIFLREIDSFLALAPVERAKPTALFFIFHLLGEWREKTAYRPLTRLLRCPGHEVDAILGD